MTTQTLTEAGREYANRLRDERDSMIASIALYGRGLWPDPHVDLAIATMNEWAEKA